MAIALIFAGGVGVRMNSKKTPKQFLKLHGKPIIVHTIENFEYHDEIDNIIVVCLESKIAELKRELKKADITKVNKILKGGSTAQESIYIGLKYIDSKFSGDEIVLIHDGVRPLITETLITNNIETTKKHGNAITVDYATETVCVIEDTKIDRTVERNKVMVGKAPQTFILKDIVEAYKGVIENKIATVDSAEVMLTTGVKLNIVQSSSYNIKVTTPSDYYIFKALVEAKEASEILGV